MQYCTIVLLYPALFKFLNHTKSLANTIQAWVSQIIPVPSEL